jgi:cobalt-precorrin-7 (C5)-methyltransferase
VAKLSIIGVGPGSPDYVTPAARKAVQEAQVVVGAERSLRLLRGDIKGEWLRLTAKNVDQALEYAAESARKGKAVVLLSTGDPGFSGLLKSVLDRKLGKGVEIAVIPGVSSVQVCAAKLRMRWDNVDLFTFHDGASVEEKARLADAVKTGKAVMLLPEPRAFPPREVAGFLIGIGVNKTAPVAVCENLTLKDERIVETTLEDASKLDFAPMCVMVVGASLKAPRHI